MEPGRRMFFLIEMRHHFLGAVYWFITEDALLNTPVTALVRFGAATATAMAISASIIAYSTTVTPFCLRFSCIANLLWSFYVLSESVLSVDAIVDMQGQSVGNKSRKISGGFRSRQLIPFSSRVPAH